MQTGINYLARSANDVVTDLLSMQTQTTLPEYYANLEEPGTFLKEIYEAWRLCADSNYALLVELLANSNAHIPSIQRIIQGTRAVNAYHAKILLRILLEDWIKPPRRYQRNVHRFSQLELDVPIETLVSNTRTAIFSATRKGENHVRMLNVDKTTQKEPVWSGLVSDADVVIVCSNTPIAGIKQSETGVRLFAEQLCTYLSTDGNAVIWVIPLVDKRSIHPIDLINLQWLITVLKYAGHKAGRAGNESLLDKCFVAMPPRRSGLIAERSLVEPMEPNLPKIVWEYLFNARHDVVDQKRARHRTENLILTLQAEVPVRYFVERLPTKERGESTFFPVQVNSIIEGETVMYGQAGNVLAKAARDRVAGNDNSQALQQIRTNGIRLFTAHEFMLFPS